MEPAQKMADPGQKETVHDLGNRLAVISGCLELLANGPPDPSKWINRALTAAGDARELVAKLREDA